MNQRDQLTDELLSAYLDGELVGQERAQVERMLADDPVHQQTLDELRALAGDVQSLPRFQLGDDFYRRVVAVAEGREPQVQPAEVRSPALGTRDAGTRDAGTRDAGTREAGTREAGTREAGTREAGTGAAGMGRPLIYGILALAAAALVMITARPSSQPQPLSLGSRPSASGQPDAGSLRDPAAPPESGVVGAPGESSLVVGPAAIGEATSPKDADLATAELPGEMVEPSVAQENRVESPRKVPGNAGPNGGGTQIASRVTTPAGPNVLVDNPQPVPPRGVPVGPQAVEGLVQYLFVVEVDLNAEATKNNLFHNALKGHGIQFSDDLKVDRELEDALLRSRMLARVEGAPENGVKSELVYVVAAGHQIDSAIRHLGRSGQVQRLRFDMGIKPVELDVFHRLRVADARDRQQRAELAAEMGRARRLLFNLAVLSPAVRQLGGQGLLGNAFGDPQGLLPGEKRPTGDAKDFPGASEMFEVLFLVRGAR